MKKTPYAIGNWTRSTVKFLEYLQSENSRGKFPQIKDLESGTFRNWGYPLKSSGHISNADGLKLTESGKELLRMLQSNPPQGKRGRKPKHKSKQFKEIESDGKLYHVLVEGKSFTHEAIVTEEQADRIIAMISKIRKEGG